MATTNQFSKAVSLTDYQPAFITGSKTQRWPWSEFFTVKQTDRLTEQIFSYTPLPLPRQTGENESFYFGETSELGAVTYTMVKYSLSHRISYELMKYDKHIRDLARKRGESAGDAHAYLRDQVVAQIFNRAFNASYPSYDSIAMCGTHTLDNGTTYDNDLTAASLSFDNLWSMINHFATSAYNHAGLLINPKARWLLTNPTNRKTVEKILEAEYEPDQGDWNPNTVKQFALKPIYCPHLTSTTAYFLIAEEAKSDFMFWNVETPRFKDEDDNNMHGTNYFSWQIFTAGYHEYINIVGNQGA